MRNFPQEIFLAASFKLADLSTIVGDLPPNSKVIVDKCLAAFSITILPILGLPVKKIWLKGFSKRTFAILESPSKNATSFSSNILEAIFAIRADELGVNSEGFTIAQFPEAIA